jgi:hypothetical protein
MVGGDLRRRGSVNSLLPQMIFDLFASRTRGFEIFLCVTTDFGLPMLAAFQFIAEFLQTQRQFGPIHCGGESLGHKQFVWLETTGSAVLALSYIEDYGVGMKLWRSIPIDWPGSVVLKRCGDESPGSLRRVYISNPGLRVSLEFLKSHSNTLAVGFPDPIIASHKRSERY